MKYTPTPIDGVFVVDFEPTASPEGSTFSHLFDPELVAALGLDAGVAQVTMSQEIGRGTVRGFHYQIPPHAETKFVHCVRGEAFDVALDVRPESATFGRSVTIRLSPGAARGVLIGPGIAHAFQATLDGTAMCYQSSAATHLEAVRGVLWDDPDLGIEWPLPQHAIVGAHDRRWPPLRELVTST